MAKNVVDKKVGIRIRRLRDAQGYSQEYVADAIGMSFGNLGKIERGEVDPKTATLYKLADILKVNVSDFFEEVSLVAEPKEKTGNVTREEWLQTNKEMLHLIKSEFAKLREEFALKKDGYTMSSRKSVRKK